MKCPPLATCLKMYYLFFRDRLSELKQLQHSERPVTGRDSRENINSFFSKHLNAQAAAQGKENIPVNVDNVEEHRPDTVVVEIQGLVEQQRVSNVLTTNFRRHLENIIRGSISTVARNPSQRPAPQSSARSTPPPHNSEHSSPVPTPGLLPSTQESRQSPVPAPRRRNLPQHLSDERIRSNSIVSSNSSVSLENLVEAVADVNRPVVERLVPPMYGEYVSTSNVYLYM